MTKNKTWGAIIPCKNESDRILSVIKSLNNQTILPVIIVVIDDGSIDDSISKVEKLWPIEVVRLPDRGYSALGKIEMAQTFNAGFKAIKKYNLDYVLVAGADNEFYNDYTEKLIEEFDRNPKLALVSGKPKGDTIPIVRSHVSGGGRLIKTSYLKKVGFGYFEINGWETAIIFEARRRDYEAYSIPVPFPINRISGVLGSRRYSEWGKGMKAIGYWFPFTYKRIIEWVLKRRFKEAMQLLKGYFSQDIIYASPELREFVKNYQKQRLWSKLKRKQQIVKLEPCTKFSME